MSPEPPASYICPYCRRESFHPRDREERYCGACHRFALEAEPDHILPTHKCFDDALDLLTALVVETPAAERAALYDTPDLVLVHAVCLAPEGPRTGERFAHAWIEERGLVWASGLYRERRIYFAVRPAEWYRELRVQTSTRYTVRAALAENARSGTYGPWREEYLALSGGEHARRTYWPEGD